MEWKLECRKSPSTKKFSPIILTVSRSIMMSETQDMQKKRVSNVQKRDARMIVAELLSTFQLCAKVNKTHQVYTKTFNKVGFLSRTGLEGSGKNTKSGFFLLGLKYTLRTCFKSKKFLLKSCPELSNQVLSFSACQIC